MKTFFEVYDVTLGLSKRKYCAVFSTRNDAMFFILSQPVGQRFTIVEIIYRNK